MENIVRLAISRNIIKDEKECSPAQFGDYTILKKLGQGASSDVFLSYEKKLDRFVALKLLSVGTSEDLQRLSREGQVLARLEHTNIINIYTIGQYNGRNYISMKYINGKSLDKASLSQDEAVRVFIKIISAMEYAHQNSVLHRDIKPANILIDDKVEPFIGDFGLAKDYLIKSSITQKGDILGTPAFMPPEQVESKVVDERSDIYSIGASLYFVLTGKYPVGGSSMAEVFKNILTVQPIPPDKLNSKIDPYLSRIVLRCLNKQKSKRYQSCSELLEDLNRFFKPREKVRQRSLIPFVLAGVLLVAFVLTVLLFPRNSEMKDYLDQLLFYETLAYDKDVLRNEINDKGTKPGELEQFVLQRKYKDALESIKSQDVKSLSRKAFLLVLAGDLQKGRSLAQQAGQFDEKSEFSYLALALSFLYEAREISGSIDKNKKETALSNARKILKEALKQWFDNKWFLNLQIQVNLEWLRDKKTSTYYEVTENDLERLIKLDNNFAEAYVHYGLYYILKREPAKSVEKFQQALKLNSKLEFYINRLKSEINKN